MIDIEQVVMESEINVLLEQTHLLQKESTLSDYYVESDEVTANDESPKTDNILKKIWNGIVRIIQAIGNWFKKFFDRFKKKRSDGNFTPKYIKLDENGNFKCCMFPKYNVTDPTLPEHQQIESQFHLLLSFLFEDVMTFNYTKHKLFDNFLTALEMYKKNHEKHVKEIAGKKLNMTNPIGKERDLIKRYIKHISKDFKMARNYEAGNEKLNKWGNYAINQGAEHAMIEIKSLDEIKLADQHIMGAINEAHVCYNDLRNALGMGENQAQPQHYLLSKDIANDVLQVLNKMLEYIKDLTKMYETTLGQVRIDLINMIEYQKHHKQNKKTQK